MRKNKGFTLVELVTTIAIVGILGGAFVSLFLPQVMLYLFLPNEIRVQIAAHDTMTTIVEGDRFARGLRVAEPQTTARENFQPPNTLDWLNFTGPILYADPTRLRYGHHDINTRFHTVEIALDAINGTLTRSIDGAAPIVISNGGAPGDGGIQIMTGDVNGDGLPAVFRYYKMEKFQGTTNIDNERGGPGPEITGYADSVIPAVDLYKIIRVDIAFRANTGGNQVLSGDSEILKRSGVKVRNFIFPDSGEWEFGFFQWPGDTVPDLLAVKKNPNDIYVMVRNGMDQYSENTTAPLMAPVTMPLAQRGDNYTYLMVDCAPAAGGPDGVPDLVEIQKSMTNNDRQMEIRIYNGNDLANATLLRPMILLPVAIPNGNEQYDFAMNFYNADTSPDLYVFRKNNNNTITYFIYDGATFDQIRTADLTVAPAGVIINNHWKFLVIAWNNGDAFPDLVAVRLRGGTGGLVRVTVFAGGAVDFGAAIAGFNDEDTNLEEITINNVDFGVGDFEPLFAPDGNVDLMWLHRNKTPSGAIEIHALSHFDTEGNDIGSFSYDPLDGSNTDIYQVSGGKSVQ